MPLPLNKRFRRFRGGFCLEEVIISVAIASLSFGTVISGYWFASDQAEWTACSMAVQNRALDRLEQVRSARWDTQAVPVIDELIAANFPDSVEPLDILKAGPGEVLVTNITTITPVPGPTPVRLVQVNCVWTYRARGPFTNSVFSYLSPNQ